MLPRFMPKRLDTPAGEILLREVQRKDLQKLRAIVDEPNVNRYLIVPRPVTMGSTVEYYLSAKRNKHAWIACVFEGEAVGTIEFRPKNWRETHVSGFGISFSKKVHGKGIALAALRYCFAWLKKNGIEKMVTEVYAHNKRARAFYKKVGFRELCRLKRQVKLKGGYGDAIIIEKFL